tara:strand:- start:8891 stop:9271 length:381 start_codon:yes stop_codon:yes gene_type:complete
MQEVSSANLITGQGIQGDRHLKKDGSRSKRQVLLMDEETLKDFNLAAGEIRENITVSGINLTQFTDGERLSLGSSVILKITGECEPCSRMDEIRPGLQSLLDGKRGMLAYVESGGEIKIGDGISSL